MRRFIIFFGPQGAGKSTLIGLMTKKLCENGRRVKKIEIMYNHLIARALYGLLIGLGQCRVYDQHGVRGVRRDLLRRLRLLWLGSNVISVLILVLVQVYIPLGLGYIIVAERYVLDTYVSLLWGSRLLQDPQLERKVRQLLPFFVQLVPRDAILICLDTSYDELKERYHETGKPVEDKTYIELQRTHAHIFMKLFKRSVYIHTGEMSIRQSLEVLLLATGSVK